MVGEDILSVKIFRVLTYRESLQELKELNQEYQQKREIIYSSCYAQQGASEDGIIIRYANSTEEAALDLVEFSEHNDHKRQSLIEAAEIFAEGLSLLNDLETRAFNKFDHEHYFKTHEADHLAIQAFEKLYAYLYKTRQLIKEQREKEHRDKLLKRVDEFLAERKEA